MSLQRKKNETAPKTVELTQVALPQKGEIEELEPEENLTTRFLQKREAQLDRRTLQVAQALIKAGFKVTDPRLAVIEEIVEFNREFEITELAQRLEARADFKPGIASVFRAVKLFTELGLLQRVHSADGCHRYGLVRGHNHQVICRCCERTVEFEGCDFQELTGFLEQQTGFQMEGHWIEFFGLCGECRRATSDNSTVEKVGNLNVIKPLPPHEHHLANDLERSGPLSVRAVSQTPV